MTTEKKERMTEAQLLVHLWYFVDEVFSAHDMPTDCRVKNPKVLEMMEGHIKSIWDQVKSETTYEAQVPAILESVEHAMMGTKVLQGVKAKFFQPITVKGKKYTKANDDCE